MERLEERALLSAVGPTAHEQYLLELINRGRLDPPAEAARYGIDLNQGLAPGTISAEAKQPLAFSPQLITAARGHSEWMLANDTFDHTGAGGSSPGDRMTAAGYQFIPPWGFAENIAWRSFSNMTQNTAAIHAGLYGSPGHRRNQMNASYREAGTGLAQGTFAPDGTPWSALLATEKFAHSGTGVFLTGVVYDDALVLADQFYTPGEGLGGVTIAATRQSDNAVFTTTTWTSGGYALPLAPGTYTVTATGGALSSILVQSNVLIGTENVKVDFTEATTANRAHIGVWRNGWFSLDMDGDGTWNPAVDKSIRFGSSDHTPIIGDFSSDGVDQVGVWRNGWFSLKDNGEVTSIRFGNSDHTPIIGDWNGDGVDQIGVWRNGWFSLNDNGVVRSIRFGSSDHTPIVGDWNGDGVSQVGVWRNGWFSLKDNGEVRSFRFGSSNHTPIIGDWNGDGVSQVGVWRNGWFSLDYNGNGRWDAGVDKSFRFGSSDHTPIIGNWGPPGGQALHAAGVPAETATAGPALDPAALEPIMVAAIADWDTLLGLSAPKLDRLQRVEFAIADLPGTMLGMTRHDTIYLDADAAGFGWYINPNDADFEPGRRLGELTARLGTDAVHRMDLLTAVMHESGHLPGYEHAEHGLMQPTLRPGVRWLSEAEEGLVLTSRQAALDDASLEPDRLDAYFAELR